MARMGGAPLRIAVVVIAAFLAAAPLSGRAFADGGESSSGTPGGADSATGAGGPGQAGTGGGGGGAGETGGNGGAGLAAPGGLGGQTPGADGADGSGSLSTGGGGGGAHGGVFGCPPDCVVSGPISGGHGGAGGDSTSGTNGGGGGAGGWGAVVTGNGQAVTVTGSISGGDGGRGGDGGFGGGGGSGGHGLYFTGTGNDIDVGGIVTAGGGGDGLGGGAGGNGGIGLYAGTGNTVTIGGFVAGGGGASAGPGQGGAGLVASDVSVTVLTGGAVWGGFSGDGVQANAITFTGGSNTLTIHTGASLSGTVAGDGDDTLVLAGTADGSLNYSSQFTGFGVLGKIDSSTWTLTGNNFTGAALVVGGRLNVEGQIGAAGAVHVVGADGTLGGGGTILGGLAVLGGTLAPGGALNQLTITGTVGLGPNTTFQVGVNAAGQNDRLMAQGITAIDSSAVVDVLAQPGKYMPSTQYTILNSTGGVTGQFDPNATTNMAFLSPSLSYDANNVYLTLVNTAAFLDAAQTYNERAVAGALDTLDFNDPLYQAVIGQTADGARQAFNALSGEIYASTQGVLVDQARFARRSILDRLLQSSYAQGSGGQQVALGASGPTTFALAAAPLDGRMALGMGDGSGSYASASAVPAYGDGLVFWTQGFGSWGSYDGNGNAATVDRSLGGFVSGVDTDLGGNWRAGAALGYTRSDLALAARRSSSDVDSYMLAAYAGGPVGSFALRAGGTWSWNDIEARRAVVFPGFASLQEASYDGDVGQLFAELAHPFRSGSTAVEPFAGLAWVHLSTDGFTEAGGAAALAVRGSNQDVGYSTLGLRAATTVSLGSVLVTPRASAAWQYAFGDTTPDLALAFASSGAGFGILGVPLARSSALLEAGLDLQLSDDARLGVSYVGQLAGDLIDNGVQGTVLVRF